MATYNSLIVRCIRDAKVQAQDDTIHIIPRWNHISSDCQLMEYVVTYRHSDEWRANTTEQILHGGSLRGYIESLIDLLAVDEQPFEKVQFDFPGMPSILTTPANLSSIRDILIKATNVAQQSWPTEVQKKKKCNKPLNPDAEAFIPESFRSDERNNNEAYRTPQRHSRSVAPPPVERRVPRHIFFDEEDGHVTRYFN
jgi:hypothetical protein